MIPIPSALGLAPEQVECLLATAGRAPSLHNTQPWRFRATAHAIELHADPERRLPVADPDGREMRIACGAALLNLRLALHGHGIRPIVTILPDSRRPDLIAVVRHGGTKMPTPEQRRLLRAIPVRRTNRRAFSDTPVAPPEQYALRRAALDEGAWLHLVQDPREQAEVQRLAVTAHRAHMTDPGFRAEVERWTVLTPERRDGVPAALGGPLRTPDDGWVRLTGPGEERPAEDGENLLGAVLTTHLSGPTAEIRTGQALEKVLLTATAEGLVASFLSQIVQVPRTREALRRLISGTRPPQAVLRIGYGWPVASTPRREVADLLAPMPAVPT